MDTHVIQDDPEAGKTELHHYDEATGLAYIEQVQDVTALVEENRALYNCADGVPQFGDGKRIASIPMVIWNDLERQGITKDKKAFRRWLNDPDNRAFRTLPGVV